MLYSHLTSNLEDSKNILWHIYNLIFVPGVDPDELEGGGGGGGGVKNEQRHYIVSGLIR